MPQIEDLYNRVLSSLRTVCEQEKNERIENQKQAKKAAERVQELEVQIREVRAYQRTASAHVDYAVINREYPPRKVGIAEIEILYRKASGGSGGATWEELYKTASSAIANFQVELREIQSNVHPRGAAAITGKADRECRRILDGTAVKSLVDILDRLDRQYSPIFFTNQNFVVPTSERQCPAAKVGIPFPVTDANVSYARMKLGPHFDAGTKSVFVPGKIQNVVLFQARLNAVSSVMNGIHAYILNFLAATLPVNQKIWYIDTRIFDRSALGVLSKIYNSENTLFAPIAENEGEARKRLSLLRSQVQRTPGSRLLVYRYRQGTLNGGCREDLQWLCANGQQYNLQVIVVQEVPDDERALDGARPDFIPGDTRAFRASQGDFAVNAEGKKIVWYAEPQSLSEEYCLSLLQAYKPQPLETRYFAICPAAPPIPKRNRRKEISLLYGIDETGEQYSLDLKDMDFSCYILGAARSGKSNLLNVLITSAILNYHPDDLELWLVDFGRTEFKRYTEHTPPHIRYVLVERTTELVCALVQRLIQELEVRGRTLARYGALKISELPENVYMPRILVIIDEFGAFKAILAADDFTEKTTYKGYMERLLKEGAKHGIHFIFANQSFTDIFRAIPEEGQQQIGLRLAMCAEPPEIRELLGAPGCEQDRDRENNMIAGLPRHQVIYRSREAGKNLYGPIRVLYLDEEDKKKQLRLIDWLNRNMQPGAAGRNAASICYVRHEMLFLDRDNRPSLASRLGEIEQDLKDWGKNAAHEEGDLLLYLGEPRNMNPIQHELLRRRTAENLLIYGNYERNLADLAEIIFAAAKSAYRQAYSVEFWCHQGDTLYGRCAERLEPSEVLAYTNGDDIVHRLGAMKQQIGNRETSKQFIIITGLPSLIDDIMAEMETDAMAIRPSSPFDLSAPPFPNDTNGGCVDIVGDFNTVLNLGSRCGIHFAVITEREDMLSSVGIQLEHFKHLAGFASGITGSDNLRFTRLVRQITESRMFGYFSEGMFMTYMPFKLE